MKNVITKSVGVMFFMLLWQAASWMGNAKLFPGIDKILINFYHLLASKELFVHGWATLSKGLSGLLIATLLGSVIGIICAKNRTVDAAMHPIVSFLYPIPKLALYPIVILVFGLGSSSKITQVALECFFPIFVQMYGGAKAISRNFVWLAQNNESGNFKIITDILMPSTSPFLLTGLRIATPIMLIVMCVTEFIGESEGLGYLIIKYSSNFEPASAFSVILTFGLIGLAMDRLIVYFRMKLIFWEKGVTF